MAAPEGQRHEGKAVATRTLIQACVLALVVVLCIVGWLAFDFLLMLFAAVLFGVMFHGISCWIRDKTGMPRKAALATFFVALLGLTALAGVLIAPSIAEQFDALSDSLPQAIERLQTRAEDSPSYRWLMERREQIEAAVSGGGGGVFGTVAQVMSSTLGALAGFGIALVLGICLSLTPGVYFNGLLMLVPPSYRPRAGKVLRETGSTLQSWLIAKLFEMLLIGVLTTLGLWLLGIELALVLGLIAGLLSFIPNVGPVLAVVPALLLASLEGMDTVLWVVGLYLLVQAIESYGLTPWLQKRIVSVPPAITIGMQLLFGLLAGTLGLLLATPLAAVGMVMIRRFYVEDLLGDRPQRTAEA
ncbi:AI-2E family transporter [Stutzerimonas nosocomialis]|uniref:AI-2E family transporter n=1 Tax=Stutzerimonas nosocomialis TaxID=1056496 RepID=UPI001108A028|nr:AI-2E family transporter [Stutzerimonas nosocomialis]TLX57976.1 AI-2E family transporter [Stutzerimonas nosocomialis]